MLWGNSILFFHRKLGTESCLTLYYPMNCSPPGSSMEFSRQEYWNGLLFPSSGNLPNPGIEPPALRVDSLSTGSSGKPLKVTFPQWVHQFPFPPTVHKGLLFSTSSSTAFINVWGFFDDSYSGRYVEHLFMCLLAVCLFRKISIQEFCLYFNWVVWVFLILKYMNSLYILDINPLLDISFAKILCPFSRHCKYLLPLCFVDSFSSLYKSFFCLM